MTSALLRGIGTVGYYGDEVIILKTHHILICADPHPHCIAILAVFLF